MALIRVKVRTILEFTKIFGQGRFEVSLADSSTVGNFLAELTNTWGDELASRLFEPDGSKLLAHIGLMVNGRSISLLQNMETVLQDEDEILILPPVGGG
jgi:molybdopterin synthase sulfur carrier subunit